MPFSQRQIERAVEDATKVLGVQPPLLGTVKPCLPEEHAMPIDTMVCTRCGMTAEEVVEAFAFCG